MNTVVEMDMDTDTQTKAQKAAGNLGGCALPSLKLSFGLAAVLTVILLTLKYSVWTTIPMWVAWLPLMLWGGTVLLSLLILFSVIGIALFIAGAIALFAVIGEALSD